MKNNRKAVIGYASAMLVFGTIGIFRRGIAYSSGIIAMTRGIAGSLFLFLFSKLRGNQIDLKGIRNNLALLIVSGIAMGFNWILLFESYRYTTVAIATLCYYMQPVILILAAPFVLKEKLNARKVVAVAAAVFGMFLVSGAAGGIPLSGANLTGIALGLGAAALYAVVVLINMRMKNIASFDKTASQLMIAGVCMIPYLLLTNGFADFKFDATSTILLAFVCIVHTGLAYALYFHSMESMSSEAVALLGYIDPITAVILSAVFLKEPMTLLQGIGAAMILGSAVINELVASKEKGES